MDMQKKLYIMPAVEVTLVDTRDVMKMDSTSPDFPGGMGAPQRRVPALGNDSVKVF